MLTTRHISFSRFVRANYQKHDICHVCQWPLMGSTGIACCTDNIGKELLVSKQIMNIRPYKLQRHYYRSKCKNQLGQWRPKKQQITIRHIRFTNQRLFDWCEVYSRVVPNTDVLDDNTFEKRPLGTIVRCPWTVVDVLGIDSQVVGCTWIMVFDGVVNSAPIGRICAKTVFDTSTSSLIEHRKAGEYSSTRLSSNKQFNTSISKDTNSCHRESKSAI